MRISDWSSDVCSSDLGLYVIDGNQLPQAPKWVHNATARFGMPVGDDGEFFVYTDWAYRSEVDFFLYESTEFRGKASLEGGLRIGEIGRASCRERVCKYG